MVLRDHTTAHTKKKNGMTITKDVLRIFDTQFFKCIYIYIYIYIYMCVCVCVCVCKERSLCIYILYTHTNIYTNIHKIHVCVYVCIIYI